MRRPFPNLLMAASLTFLPALLGSCSRTQDTFKPRITINTADGTGVTKDKNFVIEGTVLDDTGVTKITVDDKFVPLLPGSRKLARFQFKTELAGTKGEYTITAQDAAGNKSTLLLPVSVDPVKPTLSITRFERIGNTIRLAGIARDNIRVSQILVDGNRLNITPAPAVDFYAETSGVWADVVVKDSAGNEVSIRAR